MDRATEVALIGLGYRSLKEAAIAVIKRQPFFYGLQKQESE